MAIDLNEPYLTLARRQASTAGFAEVSDYLEHLIERADLQSDDRAEALDAVREGLADVSAKRVRPSGVALADLARKHGLQVVTSEK